jgi:hypothetical protein
MPAVDIIIQHGTIINHALVDEPNILVESLAVAPVREKKEYKSGAGNTAALGYRDPKLSFDFSGWLKAKAGLANQHPGTTVASLANYQGAQFGFDNADGIMVYEDPSLDLSPDDPEKIKFKVMQYPFIE